MSTEAVVVADIMCCACCGIAAVDDIKLKLCDGGCDLVKYCSDDCQKDHKEQHEQECKKRLVEIRDKDLFEQPDGSHLGECPICCLPLSAIDTSKSTILMSCCCKHICNGCHYANTKRENEQRLERRCMYCREPVAESKEECIRKIMKRIKKNDPVAMTRLGTTHAMEGDYGKALEYYTKAAELGNVEAHFCLGNIYYKGQGVEMDEKKAVHHLEQAAIGGHPQARNNLTLKEVRNSHKGELLGDPKMKHDSLERAAKHAIINANLGFDPSLKAVKGFFVAGIVSKEDYAAALRGCQAAVDATKSAERKIADDFLNNISADRGN